MATAGMDELKKALLASNAPVYYLASAEVQPLREAALLVKQVLQAAGAAEDPTRIDGPVPDMGEVIAATGAISLFGTRRLVELREISPTTIKDKDVEELCQLFGDLENAVLLVTALYKDGKAATNKKSKKIFEAAAKAGVAVALAKPTRRDNLQLLAETADQLGAHFAPGAAEALLERAGEDRELLRSETQKLAAMAGYGTIGQNLVAQHGAHNIDADVFALARAVAQGKQMEAYESLGQLLALRHEPVAIAGALAGVFVDMYRVRCGEEQRQPLGKVFKEMGYFGSDWRLKKAKDNAARFSTREIESAVLCLQQLDTALKSSALSDKTLLLEATVGQLLQLGARR